MNTHIAIAALMLASGLIATGVRADDGQSRGAEAGRRAEVSRSGELVITATPVDPAVLAEQEQQLRRNLRQMRQIIEQEAAQAAANARNSTGPLYVNTADSPSLGALREQLARSMERLEDRCFGLQAKAENGNVIVICGDNTGLAENANVRSSADTTVLVGPPPPQSTTPQPSSPQLAANEEGKP